MNIVINGEARQFPQPMTVSTLLDATGFGAKRVAVEVNLEIVPRSVHPTRLLNDGDRVEIVQAMGGG